MAYNKNIQLETRPHYTDIRFKKERTVFGKPSNSPYGHKHLHYDYSDRLWEWNYEKSCNSAKVANDTGFAPRSCNWYEAYLSAYFDRQVTIEHIIAGVNHGNGYPYAIFGYRFKNEDES